MSPLSRLSLVALAAACAPACTTAPPPPLSPIPPPSVASPPEPTGWRTQASAADLDRYARLDAAWTLALDQARRLRGSGDLRALGELIVPDAQRPAVAPPPGDYRCRTVKLGSRDGDEGLGYVVYGWFACRLEATPDDGLRFVKRTGSQRPVGDLYPEDDRRMVLLGAMALSDDPVAPAYGAAPDRDLIAVLERIGERRWRLVIPWPAAESNLDLIELVPA
jgi:hypothetical protein